MLISELYTDGVHLLKDAGIVDAELEISLLLAHILGKTRTHIYLSGSENVSENAGNEFTYALAKRLERMPLAYITGEQEFWSLPFTVSPDVLIPRPETEQMLEMVLSVIEDWSLKVENVLDLGTGSGVIAIVLAKEIAQASVVAVDQSLKSLKIAKSNVVRHGLAARVQCLCSDWGASVRNGEWDLIVSNPPYVASDILHSLAPEVQKEPLAALNGGKYGMESIYDLVFQVEQLLKPGGWFFMEIGYDQERYVEDLFQSIPSFEKVTVRRDHAGLPRVAQARKIDQTLTK